MAGILFKFDDMKVRLQIEELVNNMARGTEIGKDGNFNAEIVSVTTPLTPDTEFTLAHRLGKVPNCFEAFNLDRGGVFYKGDTEWDEIYIYLKCSTADTTAFVRIW